LQGANLQGTNLSSTDLFQAEYTKAGMFEKESMVNGDTNFPPQFEPSKVDMIRVGEYPLEYPLDFSKVDIKTVDLKGKVIYQENFDGRDLSGLNFGGAKLIEVSFENVNLNNTYFGGA
jgi:uncharacterized protein YjbI with pentapeptide repeats